MYPARHNVINLMFKGVRTESFKSHKDKTRIRVEGNLMCCTRPPHVPVATIFEISRYMHICNALFIRLLKILRQPENITNGRFSWVPDQWPLLIVGLFAELGSWIADVSSLIEVTSSSSPNPALTMSPPLVMERLQSNCQTRRTDQQSISAPELLIFHNIANGHQATECATSGSLIFQLLRYSRYRDTCIYVMHHETSQTGDLAGFQSMCLFIGQTSDDHPTAFEHYTNHPNFDSGNRIGVLSHMFARSRLEYEKISVHIHNQITFDLVGAPDGAPGGALRSGRISKTTPTALGSETVFAGQMSVRRVAVCRFVGIKYDKQAVYFISPCVFSSAKPVTTTQPPSSTTQTTPTSTPETESVHNQITFDLVGAPDGAPGGALRSGRISKTTPTALGSETVFAGQMSVRRVALFPGLLYVAGRSSQSLIIGLSVAASWALLVPSFPIRLKTSMHIDRIPREQQGRNQFFNVLYIELRMKLKVYNGFVAPSRIPHSASCSA
ncbi:hypothetical protein CLF_110555 [Clonorchis sinensis]|uniref:Uncharacterized protein n=1 Tax=Clonorchis sinensis TaxID=79923 RepID=G7YKU7_CLOSI|nr:hypothetical protein CLF_110555 [Clonorchis sinensis]